MASNNPLRVACVILLCVWMVSCDSGGGSKSAPAKKTPPDVGSNDINTVLCIGDSITQGGCAPAGAPYPARLGALSGKRVLNAGVCGEESVETAARAPRLLRAKHPGYMCLLIGANDATVQYRPNPGALGDNVRSIIRAAKAQKTVPLVATLLPMYREHRIYNGNADKMSAIIRTVIAEEGATLVDLRQEFGTDDTLLQIDGLHPTDAGTQIIAAAFNDKL